ncbi:hypothetical protein GGS24DRAFT_505699 [Hypoxylon argillaceum]|nr:hypothetical protein GGS24DRAFT_505699 [Hypoxylon argillaceum]KAI1146397.1 hypothetical protein F4825DRAFT_456520 [Nemania diffusa]
MSSNDAALAEQHTPSNSLDSVGLLIYRDDANGNPEILIRYGPADATRIYSIPNRVPLYGDTALETAIRVGMTALGVRIPPETIDYRLSAVIDNPGRLAKIRVFILKSTPDIELVSHIPNFKGEWNYVYMPLSALSHSERVYFHSDVWATRASLRELLRTR